LELQHLQAGHTDIWYAHILSVADVTAIVNWVYLSFLPFSTVSFCTV